MDIYTLHYYVDSCGKAKPAQLFIKALPEKVQLKIFKYLFYLRDKGGYLDEPYSRHITGKIRELRVDFSSIRHRIFYFTFIEKKIIILNGFVKKTQKTPEQEVKKALKYFQDVLNNPKLYEANQSQID
ncbi:MAG: type II toxin-antitoxin system RelE/ParE family toxin [Candidatus Magasanikbacteria bacterium]|nr:type II toxin-antitoxin system RelE/ParE family toxin [Candidatus Magasanikbacteria bacterium]